MSVSDSVEGYDQARVSFFFFGFKKESRFLWRLFLADIIYHVTKQVKELKSGSNVGTGFTVVYSSGI